MNRTTPAVGSIADEFQDADLGDERRTRRLVSVATSLSRDPTLSVPQAMGTDAALEATYRLLNNEAVTPAAIMAPHIRMTVERAEAEAEAADSVLCVHDTTTFEYGAETRRAGLGITRGKSRGFLGHMSLLVANRAALGTVALRTWIRPHKKPKVRPELRTKDPDRESKRWHEQALEVEERLRGRARVVHVMDREGDAYELFATLITADAHFVVRATHDRTLADDGGQKVWDVLGALKSECEREVPLSSRRRPPGPVNRKIHPPRTSRIARLQFAATHLDIARPRYAPHELPAHLRLGVVYVRELDHPDGDTPVEWVLFTNEPLATEADILRIVDAYRSRWVIEEFFKALKTGCAFMERQMESYEALVNALAISVPIAWRLLLLRSMSRGPEIPASIALTSTQLDVLRAVSKIPLTTQPTIQEATQAIARLGGHIKNNGPPGWQVLGRGLDKLLLLEVGWTARDQRDAISDR